LRENERGLVQNTTITTFVNDIFYIQNMAVIKLSYYTTNYGSLLEPPY